MKCCAYRTERKIYMGSIILSETPWCWFGFGFFCSYFFVFLLGFFLIFRWIQSWSIHMWVMHKIETEHLTLLVECFKVFSKLLEFGILFFNVWTENKYLLWACDIQIFNISACFLECNCSCRLQEMFSFDYKSKNLIRRYSNLGVSICVVRQQL